MRLFKTAGIMDPWSNTLSPDLWGPKNVLRPSIRKYLLGFISRILDQPVSIFNVVNMIGSTLTFQYTSSSDIDLSLGLKPEFDDLLPELHQRCKDAMDQHILPGTDHPINLFVSPSMRKLRPDSLSGGYDLVTNSWIRFPDAPTEMSRHRYDMSKPYLQLQQNELKRQIQQLVKNPDKLKESEDVASFFGGLDQTRKINYDFPTPAGGNYSLGNASFKYSLKGQNYGLIDRLYNVLKKKNLTLPRY